MHLTSPTTIVYVVARFGLQLRQGLSAFYVVIWMAYNPDHLTFEQWQAKQ
ncbi:MAG TPA: hypothetical protein VLL05_14270 [Terriglobales bacterium]|nr:hypothetical protein [Terriglobales bacterium]